jgi:hypothetical protein
MVHEGRFVTGDNYFVQLDLEPGPKPRTFTVLVCHKEAHSTFPFSLRLFAPPGTEVDRFALLPKDHWAHEQQIQGSWDPHKKVPFASVFIFIFVFIIYVLIYFLFTNSFTNSFTFYLLMHLFA